MTRLGGALVLGLVVTVAALAFGSRPLGVVGVGLLFAAGAARIWRGAVRERVAVAQVPDPSPAVEGARVRLAVEARRGSRVPVAAATLRGSLGRLGDYECRLRGHGRTLTGIVDLGRLPRGLFRVADARLELGDVLGLETVSIPVHGAAAVVVRPRLVELETLFSESGRRGGDGRRLLLRRTAGFDFHSVRDYEQGESLRRVHWPTTARRGQLMVKELDDAPRDAVVVLLDCDASGAVGSPPDSSFDTAVRAAGSILRVYAARGRRATLVATGSATAVDVCSLSDLGEALDALAAAEPDAAYPLARSLGHERAPAARAGELVVVTATLDSAALGAVLDLGARRLVSVVWVDAPSFAGRPTRAVPGLLRLSAAGVPVAVVRHGDDLTAALDVSRLEAVTYG
jgi:uncharacterized protein (DUF58 family)